MQLKKIISKKKFNFNLGSTGRHNIRLRDPIHILPVGRPVQLDQHPAQPDNGLPPAVYGMVERFHRCLKDALCARCAAANWVDHFPWFLLGLRAAAIEYDGTTPARAVFGSRLILPGQFLDSPELPSKDFFEQFSKTLSAAKHPSTRHNTAATH